jgi:hypothetical protein
METVTILRQLWRLRRVVVVIGVVALLTGFGVAYRISFPPKLESRNYNVAIATTRILVDTPSSQVVTVAPKGSDLLGVRANLIANLMVDGVVKTDIARRVNLRPSQLGAVAQSASGTDPSPTDPSPEPIGGRANLLTTSVLTNAAGDDLPVIEIDAQAPNPAAAARLANAAVTGLRSYLDSKAASERISSARRLRVTGLGSPQIREQGRGPGLLIAAAAAVLVFVAGCAILLVIRSMLPNWRLLDEIEKLESASNQAEGTNGADPSSPAGERVAPVNAPGGAAADQGKQRPRARARATSEL